MSKRPPVRVSCGECDLDDLQEIRAGLERACLVEPGELGVGPEAGEKRLEAVKLGFGSHERSGSFVGLDEQLDLGSHRAKAVAQWLRGKRVHYPGRGERARKLAAAAQVSRPNRLSTR